MRKLVAFFLFMFATTAMAATDIVATYKYQDGTMVTIVTRDKDHIRMDTSATTYMLIQKETTYSVSKDDNGQWMVMDMGQLKTSVPSSSVTSLFGGGQASTSEVAYATKYKKTGQKEKIAGYTGVVYNVEVKEGNNIIQRDEVVFCTHSDIKKVNEAWLVFGERMSQVVGDELTKDLEEFVQAKELGYGGMLRYGDEMRLDSLKKMSLDVSYYQVPANAQHIQMGQMPDMTQMQQQYGQQQQQYEQQQQQYGQQQQQYGQQQQQQQNYGQQQEQQQSVAGKRLEKDAEDVGQAARQETKDQTINEVKEGVRSIFKSIFD